jgi:molybdopterin/thiamine biosynthesis adenylyltransferase
MTKLDRDEFRKQHHSRNLGLLSEEDQKKITETTLLIAGCGVGSQVALSAVRIGFEKFIIVDGDRVELSNINRQGYSWRDEGRYKVDALARRMKAINPHIHVRKYPVFVDPDNADKIVKKADIVIDTIDPDAAQAVIAMHRSAQKRHKTILQPSDVGWGAMLQIFTPGSISYEKMIGMDPKIPISQINNEEAFGKFIQYFIQFLPPYVAKLAMDVAEGKSEHYPQPISASYTLAAMTVMAAKRIACNHPVKVAPAFISFDPDSILDPAYETK